MAKYQDYFDIFLSDLAIKLPKNTNINKHIIELVGYKQLFYKAIYTLNVIKLENLKTYIKIYLKIRFIQIFQSLTNTLIIFDKMSDSSLQLYFDYKNLNNLTIKEWYFFLLMEKISKLV